MRLGKVYMLSFDGDQHKSSHECVKGKVMVSERSPGRPEQWVSKHQKLYHRSWPQHNVHPTRMHLSTSVALKSRSQSCTGVHHCMISCMCVCVYVRIGMNVDMDRWDERSRSLRHKCYAN